MKPAHLFSAVHSCAHLHAKSTFLRTVAGACCVLALSGCGGSSYNVGTVLGDGGKEGGNSGGNSSPPCGNEGFSGFGPADGGGCTFAAGVACSGCATGFSCTPGGNPETFYTSQACMSVTAVDFCCISWTSNVPCMPLKDFPCDGYAFQCTAGSDPPTIDPTLTCGSSASDTNGNNDFCCTRH
jgi:hypothetical protein